MENRLRLRDGKTGRLVLFIIRTDQDERAGLLFLIQKGETPMASLAKFTKTRRRIRAKSAGRSRKRKNNLKGTTPPFPLDPAD